MKDIITTNETSDLTRLEAVIDGARETFSQVAKALAEIRDRKLYRANYKSFADYCSKRFAWAKSYGYMVAKAGEVLKSLPPEKSTIVESESQARELAKVEPERRGEVLEAVAAEGPVTAAAIRRQIPPPPPIPMAPTPPPPGKKKEQEPLVLDETGHPIPPRAMDIWNRKQEALDFIAEISGIKCRMENLNGDLLYNEVNTGQSVPMLSQVYGFAKRAVPYAVCPNCQGKLPDTCTLCKGRAMISKHLWDNCVPREIKEIRAKARQ